MFSALLSALRVKIKAWSRHPFWGWLLAGLSIVFLTSLIVSYTYYSARAALIDLKVIKEMPQASILYDYQGRGYARFFDQNRITMPADKPMPKLLAEAVVATEDRRFYQHHGVDWYGMIRAAVSNSFHHGVRQGGSTITQQLARNSIGMMQRTYDRKILEIFLALRIELSFSKDDILRYYLDRIYFGQGLYGAQTTAYAFFGCPVDQLSLSQAAMIAGMISSPNSSSPWKDFNAAKVARHRALTRMVEGQFITQAQAEAADHEDLSLRPRPDFGGGFASAEIRREVEELIDPAEVQQGGLKIFTTIDPYLQTVAEQEVARRVAEVEKDKGDVHPHGLTDLKTGQVLPDVLEGSFFAEDPATGAVRAVVGSRDFALSEFNRALLSQRQVGSTIKPLVYSVAFAEKGFCPASSLEITPFNITGSANYVAPTTPPVFVRVNDAIVQSNNFGAVRMGMIDGPDLFIAYARKCGVTSDIPPYPSSYIGACSLTLAELTGIYSTLANQGAWVRQHMIVQVRDAGDHVLYQYQPEGHRVFSPITNRQIVGMMENVLDYGTGAAVRDEYGFTAPAAGKTGTTNDYKDAWFAGFTSHLAAAVWIGYDKPREIIPGGYASKIALPVWARVMKQEVGQYAMEDFPVPTAAPGTPPNTPPPLQLVQAGGGLFGQNQRYYLTPEQLPLLDESPGPEMNNDPNTATPHKNIFQGFLDLFK